LKLDTISLNAVLKLFPFQAPFIITLVAPSLNSVFQTSSISPFCSCFTWL